MRVLVNATAPGLRSCQSVAHPWVALRNPVSSVTTVSAVGIPLEVALCRDSADCLPVPGAATVEARVGGENRCPSAMCRAGDRGRAGFASGGGTAAGSFSSVGGVDLGAEQNATAPGVPARFLFVVLIRPKPA